MGQERSRRPEAQREGRLLWSLASFSDQMPRALHGRAKEAGDHGDEPGVRARGRGKRVARPPGPSGAGARPGTRAVAVSACAASSRNRDLSPGGAPDST